MKRRHLKVYVCQKAQFEWGKSIFYPTLHPSQHKSAYMALDVLGNAQTKTHKNNDRIWKAFPRGQLWCIQTLSWNRNIFILFIDHHSLQPLQKQTHVLYTNSDTQTLKAAKCQPRSGAVSSQAWHRRLYTARWGPVSSRPCGYHGDPGLSPSQPIKMLERCSGGIVWEAFSVVSCGITPNSVCTVLCVVCVCVLLDI